MKTSFSATLLLALSTQAIATHLRDSSDNARHSRRSSRSLNKSQSHRITERDQVGDQHKLTNDPEWKGEGQAVEMAKKDVTWSTTPFNPTGIPLAVRSPYVSTWLWGGTNDRYGELNTQQASFWNGNTLPWCGTVLVDGKAFTWMGVPSECAPGGGIATQKSMTFTASQTTFVFEAGAVNITASFLSPVVPTDLVRQSLPYSYLNVTVSPNDGKSHDVQIYTDITGEWASNDWTRNITWGNTVLNNTLQVHRFQLTDPEVFGEVADSTTYGQVVYATDMSSDTTYQSGPSSSLRQEFITQGRLSNSPDTNYRAIQNNQPAFGFAKDFGTISATGNGTALWAVGHYRDPGVSFTAATTPQPNRSLYFMSEHPSMESSLSFFYNDYATVLAMSNAFDAKVQSDATSAVSAHYAALCAITARQIYSGLEITVGKDSTGAYNTSDVMVFVKEIATSNYVNTVDVINPAFPFFAYTNPDMIEYSILPVLLYAEQNFPKNILSAPHDIGSAYPVAGGAHQTDAPYYIEESANMLFMVLAHAKYSGKTDLIQQHYPILRQWAEYLVSDTLYPINQASTDDFLGRSANSTSLAVKGVVGLGCMGSIATLAGNSADATHYSTLAKQYSTQIISNAMASTNDHLKLTYDSADSSWSQLYNLLPDKLFNLGIFDDSFYAMQAAWYAKQALPYGVPLDSNSDGSKTDFSLWMAGVYHDNATLRDTFIEGVYDFLSYGATGQATPDYYSANNASSIGGFVDRPVVGGVYAPLLFSTPMPNTTAAGSSSKRSAPSRRRILSNLSL